MITTGREKVQEETRGWLQKLMDEYQSGLTVTEVKLQAVDAPDEVQRRVSRRGARPRGEEKS